MRLIRLPIRLPIVLVALLRAAVAWPQGDPVGPEFRVNTYTPDFQSLPRVAMDASGEFVVVWHGAQPGIPGANAVFGQRYDSGGGPLGPEFMVGTYAAAPGASHMAASVAADASGNFTVVWDSGAADGSDMGILGRRYASSGVPLGSQFVVNSFTNFRQYRPAAAADGAGSIIVVWQSSPHIIGQRYDASGAPLGPEFTVTSSGASYPAVAADAVGNFVVVWADHATVLRCVYGQRFASSGAPLGTAFVVSDCPSPALQTLPAVAVSASGDFVVAWSSFNPPSADVLARRFASSGVPLGSLFRVNTYTTSSQATPSVATDPLGNFVAVWNSNDQDGSISGAFGQRYASSGAPLGPEFRVNTFTTHHQGASATAADPAGRFVVVWQSYLQDGQHWGVFGQRYSPILPVELMHFRVE